MREIRHLVLHRTFSHACVWSDMEERSVGDGRTRGTALGAYAAQMSKTGAEENKLGHDDGFTILTACLLKASMPLLPCWQLLLSDYDSIKPQNNA